jgi:hypothetical protein
MLEESHLTFFKVLSRSSLWNIKSISWAFSKPDMPTRFAENLHHREACRIRHFQAIVKPRQPSPLEVFDHDRLGNRPFLSDIPPLLARRA